MVQKIQPIYLNELLIHPGETVLEMIQDRNISQKELAIRTGFSEKHISTVISGQKNISAEFAMKLEYALGVPASFWRNLQTNYDLEVVSFNEQHNISVEEQNIAKELKGPVETIMRTKIDTKNNTDIVYSLRQILGVSNLQSITTLNPGFYRAQFAENTSTNIMYVWQYLCETKVEGQTTNQIDVNKLKDSIEKIKSVMHEDASKHISLIRDILNECGILFTVEKHAKNAPIKGLTVKTKKNQVMIALTIYGKYVDIFWFTLFHEIAHVLNGDYLKNQDLVESSKKIEREADQFAADTLIDKNSYNIFVKYNDFSMQSIKNFASKVNILPTIVIGRLMNDKKIPWSYNQAREQYAWKEE